MRFKALLVLRSVISVAALASGFMHLRLYDDGYKDIPIANIGKQFLGNALGAVAIVVGLFLPMLMPRFAPWMTRAAALGATVWAAIGLIAFWQARTSGGWFGYQDQPGLNPKPEAPVVVYSEIIVLVASLALLTVLFNLVPRLRDQTSGGRAN